MQTDAPTIDRHRTALVRTDLSRPVRLALEHGLLPAGATAFDYGCGHGGDVARLQERGVPVGCWDPYYAANQPLAESDLVNLGYVLNVIEDTTERAEALRRAWSLARRVLVVSAQLLVDQAGATKVPFGDGFLTRLNTFQRYFDHAELGAYIHETLGVEPLAAGLGVYYVFRYEEDGHAFRARQFRRSARPAMVRLPKIEVHHNLVEPMLVFFRAHGRVPEPDELPEASEIASVFGSIPRAFAHVRRRTGPEPWDQLAADRREDLLVFLGLSLFKGRSRFGALPADLQRDVRALLGNYTAACKIADTLLFQLRDQNQVAAACRASPLGKRLPLALYVHASAMPRLVPLLRMYEGCARAYAGEIEGANLIKLHTHQAQVSYLSYPDFDADPHPTLTQSVEVAMRDRNIRVVDYSKRDNPPILHRKELFVAEDYPGREEMAAITAAEEEAGLLEDTARIGTRDGWRLAVAGSGGALRRGNPV